MADGTKETVRCNVEHPTEIILKVLYFDFFTKNIRILHPYLFLLKGKGVHFQRFADIIGLSIENVGNFGLFVAKRRYASDDGHFMSSLGSVKYPDTLCLSFI